MRASFILFISIFLAIYLGMHAYVLLRITRGLTLSGAWRAGLEVLFLLGALTFFLGEILSRRTDSLWIKPLISFGTVWLGIIAMAFAVFIAADILRLFFPGGAFRYQVTVAALSLLGLMTCWSLVNVATLRRVREITLTIPRLPQKLSGFTIVQLSDVHINSLSSAAWIDGIVRQTNALKPDLVVITGDLIDADICRFQGFCGILRGIESKYGVYAVSGNHEYYTGMDKFRAIARQSNIKIIDNTRTTVAGAIDLVGVDDHISAMGSRAENSIRQAMDGADPARPSILLSHRPDTFVAAQKLGFDLQLSGHTHAGQIPPMDLIVLFTFKYPIGYYTKGNSHLYVTTGTGYWGPPMRVFSISEITRITLVSQ